ncbi:MAG: hypothetical protein HKP52_03190 [Desulfofustis sp.]|nr:hypothetical protein [Desulfofustis sp.]
MDNLLSGIGNAVAILIIFVSSMVMATLTQTVAENLYPDLDQKRDTLFWVWLFIWVALFTVIWTAVKGYFNFE